jgi:hypothetical protein
MNLSTIKLIVRDIEPSFRAGAHGSNKSNPASTAPRSETSRSVNKIARS